MKKLYMIAFLVMGMALTGCKKPVAYESPEIKETSVELQSASVCFTATVNFTGNAEMVLELATLQDMSDKQEYTMNQIDETSFSVNVLDLEPYVDYFYRMVVSNANFTQSSSVKRFSIGSEMVSYGDDKLNTRVGGSNGGTYEWAVMFPKTMLQSYQGAHVSKVRFRAGEVGEYTIRIYSGGTTTPTSLLKSKKYQAAATGWQEVELYPVSFDCTQPLWISMSFTHEADEYPASAGYGIDNKNARWSRINNGNWGDAAEGLDKDITWLIRAYVEYISGETSKQVELPLVMETETEENVGNVAVEQF